MNIKIILVFFILTSNCFSQSTRDWATYYGGTGYDNGYSIVADSSGNIYLAGSTSSISGIALGGFQNAYAGGQRDAFIVKFDPNGNRIWATYYGGAGDDFGFGITMDDSGYIYLAGMTSSLSGIASGGFQNTCGGGDDAFLVKFDENGNRIWATYYGGTLGEEGIIISCDNSNNIYLAGNTNSISGIAFGGFQNTYGGSTRDGFLVKFSSSGIRLWGTYYGGTAPDFGLSVATDAFGDVYLAGTTQSTTGISFGGFQNSYAGGNEVYLVKFSSTGSRLWGTYYGDTGNENNYHGLNVDHSGNVYLAGSTTSSVGIASGGFQNTFGGGLNVTDAFLVKFNPSGNRIWATYYGGLGFDDGRVVITDTVGNVYLEGETTSILNISSNGFQNTYGGGMKDAFLVKFDSTGNRICASYFGNTGDDRGYSVASIGSNYIYLTGETNSASGISSTGFQNAYGGGFDDAFLVKFQTCTSNIVEANFTTGTPICPGTCANFANLSTNANSYQWSFPGAIPDTSTAINPQSICYNTPGSYDVTLIATNANGNDTLTLANYITVFPYPPPQGISQNGDTLFANQGAVSYQWYFNENLISAATDYFYVAQSSGDYNVVCTDGNGCEVEAVVFNVVASAPAAVGSGSMQVFPNPVQEKLEIRNWKLEASAKILIYNMLGEKLFEKGITTSCEHIDLSFIESGVYLLRIETKGKIFERKLVKM